MTEPTFDPALRSDMAARLSREATAAQYGIQLASNSHGTLAVALNVGVNFLASPAIPSRIAAEAKELSRTKRTAAYDIKVRDDSGVLVATCQALAYRKGTPFPPDTNAMGARPEKPAASKPWRTAPAE